MLTHIIPAAAFTAATSAPAVLTQATDILRWLGQHPTTLVTFVLVASVVLLIGWAFRQARRPVATVAPEPVQTQAVVSVVPARGER